MFDPLPASSAAAAAIAAAGSAESAATEPATARLPKRREICRGWTCLVRQRHVRNDLGALLQIAFEQLSALPVGNTEPQADRFQLLVDVEPRPAGCFNTSQWTKQRIDRRRAALPRGRSSFCCRLGRRAAATPWCAARCRRWPGPAAALRTSRSRRIESALAHSLQALLALFRRHVLKARGTIATRSVVAAATAPAKATASARSSAGSATTALAAIRRGAIRGLSGTDRPS
jgi:hypothetical protein